MTNWDRIKQMSIEQMTDFIDKMGNDPCMCCSARFSHPCGHKCENNIREWLKQEAEEEE